jgi:hypothetical protein
MGIVRAPPSVSFATRIHPVFDQVFGKIDVECARYSVLKTVGENIELRRYMPCVAVETPCARLDGRDGAFGRLASYIG